MATAYHIGKDGESVRVRNGEAVNREGIPMATQTQADKRAEQAEAVKRLLEWVKPGDTVYTVLRQVSRSGMSRRIDCYQLVNGEPHYLTGNVAKVCGYPFPRSGEGLRVNGCGMDMGFSVVYNLSATLFPAGFGCAGEGCPSNDHSNGDRNYTTAHHHADGGYALKQRWL